MTQTLKGRSIVTNVKALVKTKPGPGLEMVDVPEPEHGINDVLIKVLKTGICGTDLHIDSWDKWAESKIKPPLVVGHEFVGEIVAVGSNVNDFHLGQIVSGEGHLVCGRCRNCMAGRRHLCPHTAGVGVDRAGAFAEYISLPMTNVWAHADGVDLDVASIFDPFGNAAHSALSFPVLGEDVLITGAGPIGLMSAAIARFAGARHVVITDINPYRLELAEKLGVTRAVDVRSTSLEEVQKDLGMTEGFDVGLEMAGHPEGLKAMISNMAHGGKIAILGLAAEPMEMNWNEVVLNMLTIKGIYGREMYETWYAMTVMLQSGLDISGVITHKFAADDFHAAFETVRGGNAGKVIMDWTS